MTKAEMLEKAGQELFECASQLGWTSAENPKWIKRAEAACNEWKQVIALTLPQIPLETRQSAHRPAATGLSCPE
jgi:hypothetical protein